LGLDVGVDAEADGEVDAGVELDEGFQDFGVGFLVGLVGPDVLVAELASDADDVAPELLVAVGVCGAVDALTVGDAADVCFIDIDADAQAADIAHGEDGVGRDAGVGDAFAGAVVLAEDGAVEGRAHEGFGVDGL
jgi:hypothetical protein